MQRKDTQQNLAQPCEVRLLPQGAGLRLVFDTRSIEISAATLWLNRRSADALRAQIDAGRAPEAPDGVRITGADIIGRYALNIAFSDGSARGIFPWAYLMQIAAADAAASDDSTTTEVAA
jgi:DUF971 family protein